jgi:hypothetical protein
LGIDLIYNLHLIKQKETFRTHKRFFLNILKISSLMKDRMSFLTSFALGVVVMCMGVPFIHEGNYGIVVIILGLIILFVTTFFFLKARQ